MTLSELKRELARAEVKSQKLAEKRAAWPAGTSRARITTANARWARAAEYRELLRNKISELENEINENHHD